MLVPALSPGESAAGDEGLCFGPRREQAEAAHDQTQESYRIEAIAQGRCGPFAPLLSAFGYNGAGKVQNLTSQWGIRLATGLLPAVMILVGVFFFARYPIDKETEDRVELEIFANHRSGHGEKERTS
jgi:hypothetical protein